MSTTFQVSDVQKNTERAHPAASPEAAHQASEAFVRRIGGLKPEAGSVNTKLVLPTDVHGFAAAIHEAYMDHRALVLSPDDVWMTIAQGFAQHVLANAEALRSRFVAHQGKAEIVINRDCFVKGSPTNDWEGCFAEFSDAIAKHIGKKRDLLVSTFTTTGPIEKAASEVVLMDAMSAYFEYTVRTLCGIPEITLLGTPEDWRSVRERAENLIEFDCIDWIKHLVPNLQHFEDAVTGKVDLAVWRSLYKHEHGGSGGPFVSGWLLTFFPYFSGGHKNPVAWTGVDRGHTSPDSFPSGVSKVDFKWEYLGADIPMEFLAGFAGMYVDEAGAVRPSIGWGVREKVSAIRAWGESYKPENKGKVIARKEGDHWVLPGAALLPEDKDPSAALKRVTMAMGVTRSYSQSMLMHTDSGKAVQVFWLGQSLYGDLTPEWELVDPEQLMTGPDAALNKAAHEAATAKRRYR